MSGTVETDPSVCYRHPGRQSWVLCQRCGRTVCPECQIMAPVGVHCPDCVAETSGGVAWRPAGNVTPIAKAKKQRRRAATTARVQSMLSPRGMEWNASTVILGAAVALFVVGCFTSLPFDLLAATTTTLDGSPIPFAGLQVWRYLTAPLVSSGGGFGLGVLLSFALSGVFFYLTAPQLERSLGRARFLLVVAVSAVIGNAASMIAVGFGAGLSPVLFGCFAALLVLVWEDRPVRNQILIMFGINLLIIIALGARTLPLVVGGAIGGAGALWLLRTGPDRGWKARTPMLIIGAACVGFVLIAGARTGLL